MLRSCFKVIRLCSKGCEYILRALMELGGAPDTERFRAKELCAKAGVPEAYTRKVLHILVEAGFLEATPGPGGGYHLTRPAKDITLLEIIEAVEGTEMERACVMGYEDCGGENPCPLHEEWAKMMSALKQALSNMTLAEFVKSGRRRRADGDAPGERR